MDEVISLREELENLQRKGSSKGDIILNAAHMVSSIEALVGP